MELFGVFCRIVVTIIDESPPTHNFDGNGVHPHDELSWLWSMSLVTWLSMTYQFSGCSFLWQDVILEGNFKYGAVIIWLGHQHKCCRGSFQDYPRLWIKVFGWVLMKLSLFEIICPVIFCIHESGQIYGFSYMPWKMEGLLLGFFRYKKECSHYSVGNTKRLAFSIKEGRWEL